MKNLYLCLVLLLSVTYQAVASCGSGQWEVMIQIQPDNYSTETSWKLFDAQTNLPIDSGLFTGDTLCVPSGQCLKFTIYDTYGDGMCCNFGNGSYTVLLNGNTVAQGGHFGYSESTYFNCPQGFDCSNPFVAVVDTITAPAPNSWYAFLPDSTGNYSISTCDLGNTCDTKIYIYDHCTGIVPSEDNQGTTFYNDDNCANYQSQLNAALVAGNVYYIRIGDFDTSCNGHTINWQIEYLGAIVGCTDPASCNYNPLATVSDSSCVYPPSPLCPAPDLTVEQTELINSMYLSSVTANQGDCYVGEGCLAGYGIRKLIRFTTHIKNIGDEDYYIGAPDTIGNQFIYDACHHHWHYAGYAEYLLFDEYNQPVQSGFKNGFCVLDLECGGGGQGKYGCGNMGITAGCGDIYDAGLDCQWIDITDIDTGQYMLVVRVNWDHSPDKLGHYEKSYNNNWAQVCFHLYYDNNGAKNFTVIQNCTSFVDCAGDTFGNARLDCAGVCNGSSVRGDVNVSQAADSIDVGLYLDGIKEDTLAFATCLDLNGDNAITITDAARLNGCIKYEDSTHHHIGTYQNTHKHCEFPFNIVNPFDTVTFSIANVDWQNHYADLSVYNPTCYLLAYEFKMHGMVVDSVVNLAVGNYVPDIRTSTSGHIVGISEDENSLFRQTAPLNFLRVYYSALTDTQICIEQMVATLNSNYEEVTGRIGNNCLQMPTEPVGVNDISNTRPEVAVIPNPNNGQFEIYLTNLSLQGAQITITDVLGRVVYSTQSTTLTNRMLIDLSNNQSGVYILNINLKGQALTKRVLVKK
jgi:hypothetical protein